MRRLFIGAGVFTSILLLMYTILYKQGPEVDQSVEQARGEATESAFPENKADSPAPIEPGTLLNLPPFEKQPTPNDRTAVVEGQSGTTEHKNEGEGTTTLNVGQDSVVQVADPGNGAINVAPQESRPFEWDAPFEAVQAMIEAEADRILAQLP